MSSTQGVGTRPASAAPAEVAHDEAPSKHDASNPPEAEAPAVDMTGGYTGAADPNLEMLALEVLARMARTQSGQVSIEEAHERKHDAREKAREYEDKVEKAQEDAKKWGTIATACKVGAIVAGGAAVVLSGGSAAPVVLFAIGSAMKLTAMFGDEVGIKDKTLKTGLDIGGSVVCLGATVGASAASAAAEKAASTAAETAASTAAHVAQGTLTAGQGGATIVQSQYQGDVHEGHADTTAANNTAEEADQDATDGVERVTKQRQQSGRSIRAQAEEAEKAHESDVQIIRLIMGA